MEPGKHYDPQLKDRIVQLSLNGASINEILASLDKEGINPHRQGVRELLRRFWERGHVNQLTINYGRECQVSPEVFAYIDKAIEERRGEISAPRLQALVKADLDELFCVSTIRWARRTLGWYRAGAKYCQMVREANKPKRLAFALMLKKQENRGLLKKMILTDECTVQMDNCTSTFYVRQGQSFQRLRSRAKYPAKVQVYAGISWEGATKCLVVAQDVRFNSTIYIDVLKDVIVPFVEEKFAGGDYILQADSAPCHKSKETMAFITQSGLKYDPSFWPAESPDLNAIELIWHEMKEFLRTEIHPTTLYELVHGIRQFWSERMTIEKCRKYIAHMISAADLVVGSNGGPTMK